MRCSKCGYEQPDEELSCGLCGVVFEQQKQKQLEQEIQEHFPHSTSVSTEQLEKHDSVAERREFRNNLLWVGGMVSAVCLSLALCKLVRRQAFSVFCCTCPSGYSDTSAFSYTRSGHAIFALGTSDYRGDSCVRLRRHGGGYTMWQTRKTALLVIVFLVFAVLIGLYAYKRKWSTVAAFAIAVAAYSLFAFTPVHEVILLFMGHGTELVFAGIFLYRSLTANNVLAPAERPLYGAVGLFMVADLVRFSCSLIFSATARASYGAAKGGGHWMDFDRISRDYLDTSLEPVAVVFLLCCLITPVISWLAFRYEEHWKGFLSGMLYVNLSGGGS
ncbi:MAG: hypothetical protein U5N86_02895 [Planctomycetota bacterium]|nr:hypothetical protein [Planctomycetota bacterium]